MNSCCGVLLALGKRTVRAVLRVMGFGRERCFHKHHRVLSHARWSVLTAGRLLLGELLAVYWSSLAKHSATLPKS